MNRLNFQGLPITIENPKGTVRFGHRVAAPYGYIQGKLGADGDELDAFIGPSRTSDRVWVIDQLAPDGLFDEHKVLLGFRSKKDALKAYRRSYGADARVGAVVELSFDEFLGWLHGSSAQMPISMELMQQAS